MNNRSANFVFILLLYTFSVIVPAAADAGRKVGVKGIQPNLKSNHVVAWGHKKIKRAIEKPVKKVVGKAGKAAKKVVGKVGKAAKKVVGKAGKAAKKVVGKAGKAAKKVVGKAGKAAKKVVGKAGKAAKKVVGKAGKAAKKVGREAKRGLKNVEEAGKAIGKYLERNVRGIRDTLSNAEKRLRQGKVVDALWRLGTDPIRYHEKNAAKLAQESSLIRQVGQIAATAYGGPGGAAAFATWYTYRETGDKNLALRVGMISGVISAGFGAAGKMSAETVPELVRKTAVTGAVGGLAVAASGGDETAIKKGFILSGGMVLVQDGYKRATSHELDARASKGTAYCMATVGAECSPPAEVYIRDRDGNILYTDTGKNRVPRIDMSKIDPRVPHVGNWSKATQANWNHETSVLMTGISRIPGINAMSVFHDQWAISWEMSNLWSRATIAPAVVLTYIGTGAPIFDHIQKTGTKRTLATKVSTSRVTGSVSGLRMSSGMNAIIYPSGRSISYRSYLCTKGKLNRLIRVERPELTGKLACRVVYDTEKGRTFPWLAKIEAEYCDPKAAMLASKLEKWGWSCFSRED